MTNPWDRLAASYESNFKDRLCRAEDRWINNLIEELPFARSVLDVCCGPATWLLRLSSMGLTPETYFGVDSSAAMCTAAQKVANQFSEGRRPDRLYRVFKHDAHQLHTLHWAAKAIKFDLALCLLGSASYLSQPAQVISGIAEYVKPGGVALVGFFGKSMRAHPSLAGSIRNPAVPALHTSLRPKFYTPQQVAGFFDGVKWATQLHGLTGSAVRAAFRLGDDDLDLTLAEEASNIENIDECCYLIMQGTRR